MFVHFCLPLDREQSWCLLGPADGAIYPNNSCRYQDECMKYDGIIKCLVSLILFTESFFYLHKSCQLVNHLIVIFFVRDTNRLRVQNKYQPDWDLTVSATKMKQNLKQRVMKKDSQKIYKNITIHKSLDSIKYNLLL